MLLLVPREDYGSFYPRVCRISRVNTRDDKRGRNGILWENGRIKCERFARRSLKTSNHLLSRGRSQATKEVPHRPTPRFVVKVPTLFRYTSDKAMPWKYMSQVIIQELQAAAKQKPEKSINDITRTGGMTHSGRCYAPINSGTREGESSTENEGIKIATPKRKDKESINEPITEMEVDEFLKFIKHSEYIIVEQLHKLPAKISLLTLMMNSKPHREAVLKVLKQGYVPYNASIEKIDHLMENVMMTMKVQRHYTLQPK